MIATRRFDCEGIDARDDHPGAAFVVVFGPPPGPVFTATTEDDHAR